MDTDAKSEPPKQKPEDAAAQMDAAVKKAQDAERRLRRAEDGPLESMAAEDSSSPDEDVPPDDGSG